MSEYEPKEGDRVRVALEGEVGTVFKSGYWLMTLNEHRWIPVGTEVEKIAPPMPEWRDGDVIKVTPYRPAYRVGGKWVLASGGRHVLESESGRKWLEGRWKAGEVTRLVEAD